MKYLTRKNIVNNKQKYYSLINTVTLYTILYNVFYYRQPKYPFSQVRLEIFDLHIQAEL